ncbi:MAG: hypothetical protein GWN18_02360, partial [Thermoplasmata archaeon]|nr:hypothetical protein [Thermoplasmata archaeon]NIS10852.1 hypothetical protein [Thermoplasmata archaeon]NIS18787.1 hypothetical protein [Thermoplasmata archaeon]NIT75811.1 hypothetical protein [Thermoplasmata archaeon]NIU47949.1 hypothetical protein [Thermoplasmata archaeon]
KKTFIQESLTWNVTFTSVNDAPRTNVGELPLVVTIPEDSVRTFSLGAKVYDVDRDDTMTANFDSPEHISIEMDPETFE